MSMHKIPLTELEREGLNRHHLVVDAPSQLSDGFRLGMKWAHDNASADGWIGASINPQFSGRFTVDSSYGVRDAFFADGFFTGDFRWQDCQTGNDEGMENYDGVEFKVYNWMPLPNPPKAVSCGE